MAPASAPTGAATLVLPAAEAACKSIQSLLPAAFVSLGNVPPSPRTSQMLRDSSDFFKTDLFIRYTDWNLHMLTGHNLCADPGPAERTEQPTQQQLYTGCAVRLCPNCRHHQLGGVCHGFLRSSQGKRLTIKAHHHEAEDALLINRAIGVSGIEIEAVELQVISQSLILGKDIMLVDGEVLATRLEGSPLTVGPKEIAYSDCRNCCGFTCCSSWTEGMCLAGGQGLGRSGHPEQRVPLLRQDPQRAEELHCGHVHG